MDYSPYKNSPDNEGLVNFYFYSLVVKTQIVDRYTLIHITKIVIKLGPRSFFEDNGVQ